MTEVPPLLEMVGEGELAAAQSSRPAVACRIIVSSPIVLPPDRPAKPEKPLICLLCPSGP